jgi:hypothetical protein
MLVRDAQVIGPAESQDRPVTPQIGQGGIKASWLARGHGGLTFVELFILG